MEIKVFSLTSGGLPEEEYNFQQEISLDGVSSRLPQGVYSTFRTFGGGRKVLGLQAHLARIYDPARQQGLVPSVSVNELRLTLRNILIGYADVEARVRISLSLEQKPGQVNIILEPLHLLSSDIYQQGVHVITSSVIRDNPRLKSTSFIQSSSDERSLLRRTGVFEALIVKNGRVLEGMTSNFFAIIGGTIVTARYGILLGVTRQAVLRVIRKEGLVINYRSLRIDEFSYLKGAFITSSSRGIVPVVNIDGIVVGQGIPGSEVAGLIRAYNVYAESKAETI